MIRIFIITLLMTLCSICSYGQQSFFDKYAEMEGEIGRASCRERV